MDIASLTEHIPECFIPLGIGVHCFTIRSVVWCIINWMVLIGVGLYPDVAVRRQGNSTYSTEKGRKTKCHPSSLTAKASGAKCMNALECCGFQVRLDSWFHQSDWQNLAVLALC